MAPDDTKLEALRLLRTPQAPWANRKLVIAYGGGVNSTAFLLRFIELGIVPALILFSDTGGERPETYAFIKQFSEFLQARGFPPIIIVRKGGMQETLEQNCLRKKMLPSIAYGYKTCSEKFKIRAQEKFVRNHPELKPYLKLVRAEAKKAKLDPTFKPTLHKLVKVIGYDADEERRAKPYVHAEYEYWYPLIEWGWYREECETIIRHYGFEPRKSSCFFCPSMRKPEIVELRDQHPDLLQRALAMEANAELTSVKGLGRRFSWREYIASLDAGKACEVDNSEPERPCGCYDG